MAVHCPSCQAPLLDGARFCLECGAAIRPSSHPASAEATPAPVVPRATPGGGERLPAEPATKDYTERQLVGASPVGSGLNPTRDHLLELQPGGRFQSWELRRPYYS